MDSFPQDPDGRLSASLRAHFETTALGDRVSAVLKEAFDDALQAEGIVLHYKEQARLRRAALTELLAGVTKNL